MSDTTKQRLTTIEATIQPGERAQLVTPIAPADFLIESMMTGDNGLRYAALRAEKPQRATAKPGIFGRLWRWWTGGEPSDPVRLIYDAQAPSEDPDEEPGEPQDFEDFMLSLIHGGKTYDIGPDGTMDEAAPESDEGDQAQLPAVRAGERLLLDVLNPTSEPITAKVTFSGPEFHDDEADE